MKKNIPLLGILLSLVLLLVTGARIAGRELATDRPEIDSIVFNDLDLTRIAQNLKVQLSSPIMICGVITDFFILASILYILLYLRRQLKVREKQLVAQADQLKELMVWQTGAERYYHHLFNSINDGIVISEMDVNGTMGLILEVNKQASLILGRPEEELKHMTPIDLLESSEEEWITKLINKLHTSHSILHQFRVLTGEGVVKVVEVHANLIESKAGWKVIAVIRDVMERVDLKMKLQAQIDDLENRVQVQASDIDQLNQEVTFLAGTVSHDLQAPLRNIQESLENMRQANFSSDDKLAGEIDGIIHRIQRMNSLIKGILEYSRLARKTFDLVPVGLAQICSEVLLQLDALIREQNADVIIERPMPRVMAHSTTLFYVVQNLVLNAIKFSRPGVTPKVILRTETRNGRVRLWVIDNGIGIAPEYYDRIFQVFQRLHGREEYPGNGLGLAIVKRGIQRMNGTCGMVSEIGEGSRFWIELQAAPEKNGQEVNK